MSPSFPSEAIGSTGWEAKLSRQLLAKALRYNAVRQHIHNGTLIEALVEMDTEEASRTAYLACCHAICFGRKDLLDELLGGGALYDAHHTIVHQGSSATLDLAQVVPRALKLVGNNGWVGRHPDSVATYRSLLWRLMPSGIMNELMYPDSDKVRNALPRAWVYGPEDLATAIEQGDPVISNWEPQQCAKEMAAAVRAGLSQELELIMDYAFDVLPTRFATTLVRDALIAAGDALDDELPPSDRMLSALDVLITKSRHLNTIAVPPNFMVTTYMHVQERADRHIVMESLARAGRVMDQIYVAIDQADLSPINSFLHKGMPQHWPEVLGFLSPAQLTELTNSLADQPNDPCRRQLRDDCLHAVIAAQPSEVACVPDDELAL